MDKGIKQKQQLLIYPIRLRRILGNGESSSAACPPIKFSSLSQSGKILVELMQELNFGQIENLHVRCGEPCFSPFPIVIKDIVFGKSNGAHTEWDGKDFILKKPVVEMFDYFEQIGNSLVYLLIIQNGLPVRMKIQIPFRV